MTEKKISTREFINLFLLVVIMLTCFSVAVNLYNRDCSIYCTDRYGFMNAIDSYQDFCENKHMWFVYVTQGNYIRCMNSTTIQSFSLDFIFFNEIRLGGEANET